MISSINITPFTDVVLVLLVIFMIATPLLIQSGIKVNLPRVASAEGQQEKNLVITIDPVGRIFVNKDLVQIPDLKAKLASLLGPTPSVPVIIMGDKTVRYDLVIRVLEIAKSAGINKVSLGVEVKQEGVAPRR
jgi:biopolymer transport protein ExbD